jgi:hypothetical protein
MVYKKAGHADLMDQIVSDSQLAGEIKKHSRFGKPIPSLLFSGDVYSNFLNTASAAGYLPPFVILQKEIRLEISKAITLKELESAEFEIMNLIDAINESILKYNSICPPKMKKGKIDFDNIENQYKIWE